MTTGLGIPFFLRPEHIQDHAENIFGLDWFAYQDYKLHGYALPLAAGKEFWGFITSVPRANKRTYQAHIYDCVTGEIDYGNVDWSDNFATFEDAEMFLVGLIGNYHGFTKTDLWDMLDAEYYATDEPFIYVFIAKSLSISKYQVCVVDKYNHRIDSHAGGFANHQDAYRSMLAFGGKDNYALDYKLERKDGQRLPIQAAAAKRVITPAWRPF